MSTSGEQLGKVNADLQSTIQALLSDRPIAYHPILAKAVRSSSAGIFLSQLLYWTPRTQSKDGWIWKSGVEITEETALTRTEQETARRLLIKLKVLEEKRAGVPARLYFRINMQRLVELLSQTANAPAPQSGSAGGPSSDDVADAAATLQFAENPQTRLQHPRKQGSGNPANKTAAFLQSISETTTETTTENNTSVGVVGQLTELGVTKAAAARLARSFPEEYLLSKLDLVEWLIENRPRVVGENPAGFLRKAIEQDYQPPPAYRTPEQRQADAEQQQKRQAERLRELELEQQALERQEQEELRIKELARKALASEYPPQEIPGTELTTETAWQRALALLEHGMTAANYATWLKDTQLVSCDERTATIVAPSPFVVDWLRQRFCPLIEKQLADVLGYRVETRFLALTELDGHSTKKDQSAASSTQGSTLGRE